MENLLILFCIVFVFVLGMVFGAVLAVKKMARLIVMLFGFVDFLIASGVSFI
jgi:hypothetical protein